MESQLFDTGFWRGSADFEDCAIGRLRWRLDRWKEQDQPRAIVCMANPSFAGADINDPTIRRLMTLLDSGFTVVNWEPIIATDPKDLYRWREANSGREEYKRIENRNVEMIRRLSESAKTRYIAWGNLVPMTPHTQRILSAMSCDQKYRLNAFGLTQDGSPKHPMARGKHRIPDDAIAVTWRESA